jgi:hypothetical protein
LVRCPANKESNILKLIVVHSALLNVFNRSLLSVSSITSRILPVFGCKLKDHSSSATKGISATRRETQVHLPTFDLEPQPLATGSSSCQNVISSRHRLHNAQPNHPALTHPHNLHPDPQHHPVRPEPLLWSGLRGFVSRHDILRDLVLRQLLNRPSHGDQSN